MRFTLLLAGLVGVTSPAFAQTAIPTYQDAVVVTATLTEEDEDEVPAAVTVIDAAEIEARQATEIAALLRTVPGLAVVRSGSPGKVTSLFSRGAGSGQTLVLWNGLELNDPYGGGFDWAFLPTEGVERVEVVRGPFSALYGADAVGGVVQVLTGRHQGAGLRLEGGSDGYRRAGAVAGLDAGSVHFDLTGHLRRGDGAVANDFFDAEEAAVRLDWRPRETVSSGLLVRAADAEVGIPFDFFGNPSPERLQTRRLRQVALPLAWQGRRWGVEGSLSHFATDLAFADPTDPFAAGDTEAAADRARAVATVDATDRLWLAVGADWERQEATSTSPFTTVDGVDQATWAGFGEAHLKAGRVSLDLGVRRDDNDAFGEETTVKLGAVAALGAGARVRASFGQAFRAPTLVDLYFPGFGNPDLRPETADALELGIEGEAGPWRLGLSAFALEQDDLIVFDFATGRPENVGRARSRGLEGEARFERGGFRARLAATRLEAENLDTGEELPRRPGESASLVLSWSGGGAGGSGGWTLAAVGRYVGSRSDLGEVRLAAYSTVDLAASWRAGRRFEPYARVDNLLDEGYEEADGFPAPGRALVGGLAVRF